MSSCYWFIDWGEKWWRSGCNSSLANHSGLIISRHRQNSMMIKQELIETKICCPNFTSMNIGNGDGSRICPCSWWLILLVLIVCRHICYKGFKLGQPVKFLGNAWPWLWNCCKKLLSFCNIHVKIYMVV